MRMNFSTLVLFVCASIAPVGLTEGAHSVEPTVSASAPMQRTVAISKISAKTSSQVILIAERKNPGWKVVKVKEHSKHWGITMKKP